MTVDARLAGIVGAPDFILPWLDRFLRHGLPRLWPVLNDVPRDGHCDAVVVRVGLTRPLSRSA